MRKNKGPFKMKLGNSAKDVAKAMTAGFLAGLTIVSGESKNETLGAKKKKSNGKHPRKVKEKRNKREMWKT